MSIFEIYMFYISNKCLYSYYILTCMNAYGIVGKEEMDSLT